MATLNLYSKDLDSRGYLRQYPTFYNMLQGAAFVAVDSWSGPPLNQPTYYRPDIRFNLRNDLGGTATSSITVTPGQHGSLRYLGAVPKGRFALNGRLSPAYPRKAGEPFVWGYVYWDGRISYNG